MAVDSYKWLPYSLAAWMQQEYQGPDERITTPFAPLTKPLSETRFALLTTGGLYLKDRQQPFDVAREAVEPEWGDPSYRIIPKETQSGDIAVAHTHYNPADAEQDRCIRRLVAAELAQRSPLPPLAPAWRGPSPPTPRRTSRSSCR